MGQDWWNKKREEAYKANNYHCWACGIHKKQAKYHQWLEAHESYWINYENGTMELKEIVALCHSCHNFIHSGRLEMLLAKEEINEEKTLDILYHGFRILKENNLKPFYGTARFFLKLKGFSDYAIEKEFDKRNIKLPNVPCAAWDKWRLIIEGKKYVSFFHSEKEWKEFYK